MFDRLFHIKNLGRGAVGVGRANPGGCDLQPATHCLSLLILWIKLENNAKNRQNCDFDLKWTIGILLLNCGFIKHNQCELIYVSYYYTNLIECECVSVASCQ